MARSSPERASAERASAERAEQAADALNAFLHDQSQRRRPAANQVPPAPVPPPVVGHDPAKVRLDRPAASPDALQRSAPLRLAHTDWLRHTLVVHGGASDLAAFQHAAAGAGTVPWHLDADGMEEDFFHLLVTSPGRSLGQPLGLPLGLPGARVLAAQLRGAVEQRQALANARVGHSHACPFDLHSLVPVPDDVLRLGPDHPQALAWLWQHWGTTEPLRHVAVHAAAHDPRGPSALPGQQAWTIGFWAADWTPWQAIQRSRDRWPTLGFDVRPVYEQA